MGKGRRDGAGIGHENSTVRACEPHDQQKGQRTPFAKRSDRRRETVVRSMDDLSSSTAGLEVPSRVLLFPLFRSFLSSLSFAPYARDRYSQGQVFFARRSAPPLPVPGFRSRCSCFPPFFVGPCCCPFFLADGSVPERRKNRRDGSSGLRCSRGCGRRSLSGSVVGFSVCRCGAACT